MAGVTSAATSILMNTRISKGKYIFLCFPVTTKAAREAQQVNQKSQENTTQYTHTVFRGSNEKIEKTTRKEVDKKTNKKKRRKRRKNKKKKKRGKTS